MMEAVVDDRAPIPERQPRSFSLHVPRRAVDESDQSTSLRSAQTDPDLGQDGLDISYLDDVAHWRALDDNTTASSLDRAADLPIPSIEGEQDDSSEPRVEVNEPRPFHRWMSNLHKRAKRSDEVNHGGISHTTGDYCLEPVRPYLPTRKSSTGSSFAFVTGVHSASISLASASFMAPRRRLGARSSHGCTDRSSRASTPAPRLSEDSYFDMPPQPDPEVTERSLQRRRILEELLKTEEDYISDIRFLMNVYVTLLASLPTQFEGLRQSINRNLTEIIELHDGMLDDIQRAVPCSEYSPTEIAPKLFVAPPTPARNHHRWHSLDSVTENNGEKTWTVSNIGTGVEPATAAEVARIFGRQIHRFFVYEEYGAKYEMMIKDVASAQQTMPEWNSYQRGLEALAASLGSKHQHVDDFRKALTISDLLVKPIQRVCRYPLLFSELLKYTPACDCPDSQMEIESVLFRLREATSEINRATDDPDVKAALEKTWLLQDRLVYPNQRMDAVSKSKIRSFGQVQLCGALHVCWQTSDGVEGTYMISLLYKDRLCLASAEKGEQKYTIRLCIGLSNVRLEEVDNGRGLQCHTAPFSWKLVFEHDCQLYEVIMTGSNPKEEAEWRTRLGSPESDQTFGVSESTPCDAMNLEIKSLGTIFGKPGSIARRVSIQRATTVGPRSALYQVILKNTTTVKDISSTGPVSAINRSQSLLTTNTRVPVLAPSQGERARVEALLADVWSRTSLPFPGIASRSRSEQLVRSSASTVMRKLSAASISSSFSKRSVPANPLPRRPDHRPVPKTSYGEYHSFNKGEKDSLESKLPMITDEADRLGFGQGVEHIHEDVPEKSPKSGGLRRFKSYKSFEAFKKHDELDIPDSPVLRAASINSLGTSNHSIKSHSAYVSDNEHDENVAQCHPDRTTHSVQRPSGKKWARVKTINRGFKASGLRSLFR